MTPLGIFNIYFNSTNISFGDIGWYWSDKVETHISKNMKIWLENNGFNWPMTEEQEVEFKFRFYEYF